VVVHVDAPLLADADHPGQAVLENGVRVSAETSQRLACDASRVVMRRDSDGRLLEIGARTRTIPPALRRALQHRDRGSIPWPTPEPPASDALTRGERKAQLGRICRRRQAAAARKA
jgi:hypothetical protein